MAEQAEGNGPDPVREVPVEAADWNTDRNHDRNRARFPVEVGDDGRLSPEQVGELCDPPLTDRTVRKAIGRGELPATQLTGLPGAPRWRIAVDDALAWAQKHSKRRRTTRPKAAPRPIEEVPGGGDVLDTRALERALDRARIVELERQVIAVERDALAKRVAELEDEVKRLRHAIAIAVGFVDGAQP